MPSTPMPFCVSNASMAALLISLVDPWIHCDVSAVGMSGQRQEKLPGWSVARSAVLGAGPLGAKPSGRKFKPARSCCTRNMSPGTTLKVAVDPADSSAPSVERTPEAPPGMLSTSWEAGTSGESRS